MPIAAALYFGATLSASGQDPLAKCKLQDIAIPNARSKANLAGGMPLQSSADGAAIYRRGPGGDWLVPETVDPKDPTIRGLLMTPDGPIPIKMDVQVGGSPFRAPFEQWIDAALEPKKNRPFDARPTAGTDRTAGTAIKAESSPERFQASSPAAWLGEYVKNASGQVERFEARWLLAQRAGGPALMELERFSAGRAAAAPLVQFLDLDGDGTLAAAEIRQAASRLAACDFNQDGSVELAEVERFRPRKSSVFRIWSAEPLFVVVNDQTDWPAIERIVKRQYAGTGRSAGSLDASSLARLASGGPELSIRIRFGQDKAISGVELTSIRRTESATNKKVRIGADAIAVDLGHVEIDISAAQPADSAAIGQVSVGAVVEGSPLWSLVDTDNDNRLSIRERGAVSALLADVDENGDGALAPSEIPTRIRLGIALGPNVHLLLARRQPPVSRKPLEPREKAPDWFASMDANGDGDLTAGEFVGTREQFASLDVNGDGLLSAKEAAQAAP